MNWKLLGAIAALIGVGASVALGQGTTPTIVQGDYISNVFGQSNFVKNPNAKLNTNDVTVSSATVSRSPTTALVATSEFNVAVTSANGTITWATRSFDAGMKNQNCEARFTYRGFQSTSKAHVKQGANTVATLNLSATGSDPRIASINFPCGDLSQPTTFVVTDTAILAGTNEIGGLYLGLATNQANVAQAELVGTWKMVGAANCAMTTATTSFDQFNADSDCNSPTVTGSVSAAQGKRPWIEINNPKPGNYYVIAKGSFYNTATNLSHFVRLTAIKSAGSESTSQLRIYGGTSTLIVPMTLSMTTTFTSGTLGFSMDGATDNTATPVSLQNDTSKTDVTFEVYRFPTSSELVVTPERQNVWGGVVYTGQNQSLFAGTAEPTAFTPFNNATWNQPTLLKGKAAVTTTNSGNDLGFSIPNLPVGQYKVEISGLLNTEATTTNGVIATCNFKIVETTTSTDVAKQANEVKVPALGLPTRDWTNAFSGVFNNTSVATRNFRLEASKFADNDASNNSGCQAFSNTGTTSALNTNITFLLTPLDQPSNSALYVQGPVLASQTGAAISSGYVGEELTAQDATAQNTTSAAYNLLSLALTPGVWDVSGACAFNRNGATISPANFISSITNQDANAAEWAITQLSGTAFNSADGVRLPTQIFRVTWNGSTNVTAGSNNTSSNLVYVRCYPGTFTGGPVTVQRRIRAVRVN